MKDKLKLYGTLEFNGRLQLPSYLLRGPSDRWVAVETTYLVGDESHYMALNNMIDHVSSKNGTALYSTFVAADYEGSSSKEMGHGFWGDIAYLLGLKTMDECLNLDHPSILSPTLAAISADFNFDPAKLEQRRKNRAKIFSDRQLYEAYPVIHGRLARLLLLKSIRKTPTILNPKGYLYSVKLTDRLVADILKSHEKDITILTEPALTVMIVKTLVANGFTFGMGSFETAITL